MSLWRLEWLRLTRTRRVVALASVYLLFGFLGPVAARYLNDLIGLAGDDLEGATIELPDPVPADGMAQYVANAMQLGVIVTVVVAAGALAIDATPEMGAFLRTRVRSVWRCCAAPVVTLRRDRDAYALGALAAWYETWALLGGLPADKVLPGIALGLIFLAYVVATTAAVAQWTKGVLATVMVALLSLLVLPAVGVVDVIGRWLPSSLATALADLPAGKHDLSYYAGPAVVTLVTTAGLIGVALAGAAPAELVRSPLKHSDTPAAQRVRPGGLTRLLAFAAAADAAAAAHPRHLAPPTVSRARGRHQGIKCLRAFPVGMPRLSRAARGTRACTTSGASPMLQRTPEKRRRAPSRCPRTVPCATPATRAA